MSRKSSGLINRIESIRQDTFVAAKMTYTQYMTDTAAIALNNLGWGEKRIIEFRNEWEKVYAEYREALSDTPETDYYRYKFDERLKPIRKIEPLIPFETRYEFLKEMRY